MADVIKQTIETYRDGVLVVSLENEQEVTPEIVGEYGIMTFAIVDEISLDVKYVGGRPRNRPSPSA